MTKNGATAIAPSSVFIVYDCYAVINQLYNTKNLQKYEYFKKKTNSTTLFYQKGK